MSGAVISWPPVKYVAGPAKRAICEYCDEHDGEPLMSYDAGNGTTATFHLECHAEMMQHDICGEGLNEDGEEVPLMSRHQRAGDGGDAHEDSDSDPFGPGCDDEERDTLPPSPRCSGCSVPVLTDDDYEPGDVLYCEPCHDVEYPS